MVISKDGTLRCEQQQFRTTMSELRSQRQKYTNYKVKKIYTIGYSFIFFWVAMKSITAAATPLTVLFNSRSFQGSWQVISHFQVIGEILSFIISLFCFIGLVLVIYAKVASILYLSYRPLWNEVHEIKQANKGENFGLIKLAKGTWDGSASKGLSNVGFDAFLIFIYGLLPDIRQHSDYAEGNTNAKLNPEEDTVASYFMATFLQTVLVIFFFTIGFSGTLARAYGTVVNALAAAANNMVDVDLTHYVNEFFAMGHGHKFILGLDGRPIGEAQQGISEDIYRQFISEFNVLNGVQRNEIGTKIEAWVKQNVTADKVQSITGVNPNNGNGWNNLKYQAFIAPNAAAAGAEGGANGAKANAVFIPYSSISNKVKGNGGIGVAINLTQQEATPNYFNNTPAGPPR